THAARCVAVAQTISAQRGCIARVEFRIGLVSLDGDAMMPHMSALRPALTSAVVKYLLIVCAVVGAVTLYLLATASANTALFAQHYPELLALNGGLAVCLALL